MRHFSHRRKYTACSSRDSFAYSESPHYSYPRCHGLRQERVAYKLGPTDRKETTAFLESRSAKASSTNKFQDAA